MKKVSAIVTALGIFLAATTTALARGLPVNGCGYDLSRDAPFPIVTQYKHVFDEVPDPDEWTVLAERGYRSNAHPWLESYLIDSETHPAVPGGACGSN